MELQDAGYNECEQSLGRITRKLFEDTLKRISANYHVDRASLSLPLSWCQRYLDVVRLPQVESTIVNVQFRHVVTLCEPKCWCSFIGLSGTSLCGSFLMVSNPKTLRTCVNTHCGNECVQRSRSFLLPGSKEHRKSLGFTTEYICQKVMPIKLMAYKCSVTRCNDMIAFWQDGCFDLTEDFFPGCTPRS